MRRPAASLLLVLAVLLAAPSALAQDDRLAGTFTYAPGLSDDVEAAIDRGIEDLNFVFRAVARRRLRSSTEPSARFTIGRADGRLVISTNDDGNPTRTPPDGTPVAWTRSNGEALDVSTRWDGRTLVQAFQAEDGRRENAYTLSDDGRAVSLAVTLTSPRLSAPIRYTLVYRRAED